MVKFKAVIQGENVSKLFGMYAGKWKSLLSFVFSIPRNRDTYTRVEQVKQCTSRDSLTVDQVIEDVTKINDDGARYLLDCAPLFDVAPYDLKVYILAVLGCSTITIQE